MRSATVAGDRRRRALVIDDTELIRWQMVRCLERHGFDAAQAANGDDGWQVLLRLRDDHNEPDVLVVDGHMPIVDGPALIRRLRESAFYDWLPILLVSGSACDSMSLVAMTPPVPFLAKPFTCTQLIVAVDALLSADG